MLKYFRFSGPAEPQSAEVTTDPCQYTDDEGDMSLCEAGTAITKSDKTWSTAACTNCRHAIDLHGEITSQLNATT